MKKCPFALTRSLFLFFFLLTYAVITRSQVPHQFNCQGIARDTHGQPLHGRTLRVKVAVLPGTESAQPEFVELHTVTTNAFGLYTLQIGSGEPLSGNMKQVSWESGNKYVRVEIDPEGGNRFQTLGTAQLLSVPYALYAEKAGSAKRSGDRTGAVSSNASHVSGDVNYITKFTALNTIGRSRLFDNGVSFGIGTASPASTTSVHIRRTTNGQYLYLENPDSLGLGSFRMYNDVPANFATFTKYGSQVSGGYTGIADKYPFANILGYGNNGPFLNAGTGNIGFAITKNGTNRLKIHIDAATEKVSIGGSATPTAQVHFNNTDAGNTGDTLRITNGATGHAVSDGLEIRITGNNAAITNRENAALVFGTAGIDRMTINASGQVGIATSTPANTLHIAA